MVEDVIIGTHNSMSYADTEKWWMTIGDWIAGKCQSKHIKEQIDKYGCIDLRVFFDIDLKEGLKSPIEYVKFGHGKAVYKPDMSLKEILEYANTTHPGLYVRFIYEKGDDDILFKQLCKYIESTYKNLKFTGGYKKDGWKRLYTFKTDVPESDIHQWVSSMASDAKLYEKACPRLYASRMNKTNLTKVYHKINLFDFI